MKLHTTDIRFRDDRSIAYAVFRLTRDHGFVFGFTIVRVNEVKKCVLWNGAQQSMRLARCNSVPTNMRHYQFVTKPSHPTLQQTEPRRRAKLIRLFKQQ